MAKYLVPNLGPSVQMNEKAEDWARKIGSTVQNKEFDDLAAAKAFADRIGSRVVDPRKQVVYDPKGPAPAPED